MKLILTFNSEFDPEKHCPKCKGTGDSEEWHKCGLCDGTGEDEDGDECPRCDGDGKNMDRCPACKGEGTLEAYENEKEWRRVRILLVNRYGHFTRQIRDYWMAS